MTAHLMSSFTTMHLSVIAPGLMYLKISRQNFPNHRPEFVLIEPVDAGSG
jgi:hypothetical protein